MVVFSKVKDQQGLINDDNNDSSIVYYHGLFNREKEAGVCPAWWLGGRTCFIRHSVVLQCWEGHKVSKGVVVLSVKGTECYLVEMANMEIC